MSRLTRKIPPKGPTFGEQLYDHLLQADQTTYTVEDILEEYKTKYAKEIESTVEANHERYGDYFFIFVMSAKAPFTPQMVRNWFIARKTAPMPSAMMRDYPSKTKTLYEVNLRREKDPVTLVWSLPSLDECNSVLKSPRIFDAELVGFIMGCFDGSLDDYTAKREKNHREKQEDSPFKKLAV